MIGVKETVKKDFETGKDGEKQYQNMKNFSKIMWRRYQSGGYAK